MDPTKHVIHMDPTTRDTQVNRLVYMVETSLDQGKLAWPCASYFQQEFQSCVQLEDDR